MLSGRSARGATRAQPSQHSQARITSGLGVPRRHEPESAECVAKLHRLVEANAQRHQILQVVQALQRALVTHQAWQHAPRHRIRFSECGKLCDADAKRQVACSRALTCDAAALPCAGKPPSHTHARARASERTNKTAFGRTRTHARARAHTPRLAVCLSLRMRRNLKVHALLMKPHNDGAVLPQQVLLVRALRPRDLRCPVLQQAAPCCNTCSRPPCVATCATWKPRVATCEP